MWLEASERGRRAGNEDREGYNVTIVSSLTLLLGILRNS